MITHSEAAQEYSELKRKLAQKYPDNIQGYMDGKDGFIKEIDLKAAKWRASY
ncbi:GrpB family protein [Microcoleus sp.]|uniref:GrpB family protein n=1 Tax=Microcoleus sp. TaxID=44472 RepID=UPI00403EEB44